MDTTGLINSDQSLELVGTVVRSMLFTAFGTVTALLPKESDGADVVQITGSVSNGRAPFIISAKVVYLTTSKIQIKTAPVIGDRMLVVGLQAYSDKMFLSKVPLTDTVDNSVQHYTMLGCVAIPMDIATETALLSVSTDSTGTAVTINEGTDPVVRWSELNKALQGLVYQLNNHVHAVSGTSTTTITIPPVPEPIPTTTPFEVDISDAASDVLKVPPKETP